MPRGRSSLPRKISWWTSVWTFLKNCMMFTATTSKGAPAALPRPVLQLLSNAGVRCNVLVTVSRQVAQVPLEVHNFLKSIGVRYIQLNPVDERLVDDGERLIGLDFSRPSGLSEKDFQSPALAAAMRASPAVTCHGRAAGRWRLGTQ